MNRLNKFDVARKSVARMERSESRVASLISCSRIALSLSSGALRASRWLHPGDEAPPQWAATNVRIVVGYRMTAPGAKRTLAKTPTSAKCHKQT